MIRGFLALHSIRNSANECDLKELNQIADTISLKLNLKRKVKLAISEKVLTPFITGHFRPFVFLPIPLLERFTLKEIQLLFIHEFAHVLNGDFLINIWIRILECLFFFNPFFKKIIAEIELERECRCDSFVISETDDTISYIDLLLKLGKNLDKQSNIMIGFGGSGSEMHLLKRVERMLGENQKPKLVHRYSQIGLMLFLLSFSLFLSLATTISFKSKVLSKNETLLPKKNKFTDVSPSYTTPGNTTNYSRVSPLSNKEAINSLRSQSEFESRIHVSIESLKKDLMALDNELKDPSNKDEVINSFASIFRSDQEMDLEYNKNEVRLKKSKEVDSMLTNLLSKFENDNKTYFTSVDLKRSIYELVNQLSQNNDYSFNDEEVIELDGKHSHVRINNLLYLLQNHLHDLDFWIYLSAKNNGKKKKIIDL